MVTEYMTAQNADYEKAAGIIRSGGLVAFPTETVYGLGGSALDPLAAEKIYRAKGRPSDNPLIVHLTQASQAEKYAYTCELYYRLTDAFSPGPLTVILPKKDTIPTQVTGGLDTVALRIPSHPVARALISACGVPIAAPSANLSGHPSPTSAKHVKDDLDGRIDLIIDGGDCDIGVESTVVKLSDGKITILRPGAITEEMLGTIAPTGRDGTLFEKPAGDFRPQAPGMKYRHYAPKAPVYLVRGSEEAVAEYMEKKLAENPNAGIICRYADESRLSGKNVLYLSKEPEGQARELFSVLRAFDKTDADVIYSVVPPRSGEGLAVLNRLTKASGFKAVRADGAEKVIGLTGQSGAGKSEVCLLLEQNGFFCIDCDRVYASLLYPGSPLLKRLSETFGERTLLPDGGLDRTYLSGLVFSDPEKLKLLNSVTHAKVLARVNEIIHEQSQNGVKLFAVDAPQLFEAGYDAQCDAVIGVCAPEQTRMARLALRDGKTPEQLKARLSAQRTEEFFRVHCDYIIENDSTPQALARNTAAVVGRIKGGSK